MKRFDNNIKKTIIYIVIVILNFISIGTGFSQERRNPFKDWFPVIKIEPEKGNETSIEYIEPEKTFDASIYNIEGLIWGPYKPKAIINNQIYNIGDKLGEAEISKINKEGVALVFEDKEYVINTKKEVKIKEIKEVDNEL